MIPFVYIDTMLWSLMPTILVVWEDDIKLGCLTFLCFNLSFMFVGREGK